MYSDVEILIEMPLVYQIIEHFYTPTHILFIDSIDFAKDFKPLF